MQTFVIDLMTRDPVTCLAGDMASVPAGLMWEHDCGVIPVLDTTGHLVGVVTDRDLCMAAYSRDERLGALLVRTVMSNVIVSCGPKDSIPEAEERMARAGVRRLPVVDASGTLLGILSINDLVRSDTGPVYGSNGRLLATLAAISQPRRTAGVRAP